MKRLIELLHSEGCSCVIESQGEIRAFRQRGVADLYGLYQNKRDFIQNAQLADKVIGKGAAALIALGKMKEVYADIISTPALSLLQAAGIKTSFGKEVPFIINRAQTGRCPLESLCAELDTAEEIYPIIEKFVAQIKNYQQSRKIKT